MSIPANRIVAFVGPYISVLAGAVATWLLVKLNALGIPGLSHDTIASAIGSALVFSLTSLLAWAGHSKWLKGHHVELQAAAVEFAANRAAIAHEHAADAAAVAAHGANKPDTTGKEHSADHLLGEGRPTKRAAGRLKDTP